MMADEVKQVQSSNEVNETQPVSEPIQEQETPKVFTQKELEKIIAERLERERKKYKDYDELKKVAEEYKKMKEAQMTEEEKLQSKLAELEAAVLEKELEVQEAMIEKTKMKVAMEMGLPADALDFISGSTEEEIREAAEKFKNLLGGNYSKVGKPSAPATAQSGSKVWTRSEIENMSREELIQHREEIKQAMKEGRIIDK